MTTNKIATVPPKKEIVIKGIVYRAGDPLPEDYSAPAAKKIMVKGKETTKEAPAAK